MSERQNLITVKEARKIIGKQFQDVTDGELQELITQQEQILRFIFRLYTVHKKLMVE